MKLSHIIIHCSDSDWGNAKLIRSWHLARGWKDIGYHKVILNGRLTKDFFDRAYDGKIENGRPLGEDAELRGPEIGSHCLGLNAVSIGVCFIGVKEFSTQQRISARSLIYSLMSKYKIPVANVLGHCETPSGIDQGKTCPNMDMAAFRAYVK